MILKSFEMSTMISVCCKDKNIIRNWVCGGLNVPMTHYCHFVAVTFENQDNRRIKAETVGCTCVSLWVYGSSYSLFFLFRSSLISLIPHHPHSSLRTICTFCYSSYCFCRTSALWNPPMKGAAGWKISPLKDTISKKEILVGFFIIKGRSGGLGTGKVTADKI